MDKIPVMPCSDIRKQYYGYEHNDDEGEHDKQDKILVELWGVRFTAF